jgi:tripartite ATP-independent transporter DctM subunit
MKSERTSGTDDRNRPADTAGIGNAPAPDPAFPTIGNEPPLLFQSLETAAHATLDRNRPAPLWSRLSSALRHAENTALVIVLAAMIILPVSEVLRRMGLPVGIRAADDLLRHFTLVAGMLGGMVAARENRLLALSNLPHILTGWKKKAAAKISGAVAVLITAVLCGAAMRFVAGERETGSALADGIPTWWFEAAMPLGFGVIAFRLLRHSAESWRGRALVALAAAAMMWLGMHPPVEPARLLMPALGLLLAATVLGAPIIVTLGGAAVFLFWARGAPLASLSLDHYGQVTNPLLAMIPLFTLAGYFLAESGASKRLVRVFMALFGHIRGGPAVATALVCAFFTTFTGGSGVTILALGGLLMPVLLSAKFSERNALGLLTGAGSLGILFPPCLPLILYGLVAQISVKDMFLGGILPGLLMLTLVAAWGVRAGAQPEGEKRKFNGREAAAALWAAKWELLLPAVAFGTFFSRFALAAEAAAVTALYAFFAEAVIHRDLKLKRDVPRVMTECGQLVGVVLLILGTAMGFTNFLITEHVPEHMVDWVTAAIKSPLVFLLVLNLILLVVGCLMDIFSAIIVVVPLIVPLGTAFGIDPVHLGIIFLANLELGYLAPPAGMNLFLSSYRFKKPMTEVIRAVLPIVAVLMIGVLLITYVPPITTWLPQLFR